MRPSRPLALLASLWLAGCAAVRFDQAEGDAAAYAARNPYYAEFCALSQIKKKPGFGADIRGEIGGHAVFYLNGACLDGGQAYPVLRLCDGRAGEADGTGLSMNAHFLNAKFVAVPGRDFFFHGNLAPGAPLTQDVYRQVQDQAKRLRLYDGITFHEEVFADMPPGWTRADWKYEVSAATDYAVGMGRGRYCARVPVDRTGMAAMVGFLNGQNAPYRAGKVFEWSVFRDNCIHLAHNALAAAGLWDEWPINRFVLFAMFDFPVPRNEFVNVMRQTNASLPADPGVVYHDLQARRSLLEHGVLPTRPDALAETRPPQSPNEVYDTDVKLVFMDEPLLGSYQGWFDQIFADPRHTNPAANRRFYAQGAQAATSRQQPLDWWLQRQPYARDPAGFSLVYRRFYDLMGRLADQG